MARAPGQLWFPGFQEAPAEPPPRPRHHLFFALKLDEPTTGRVVTVRTDLQRAFGLRERPVEPENLHLALFEVASTEESPRPEVLDRARRAAASVVAAPFLLELHRVVNLQDREAAKPLVLTGQRHHEPFVALQRGISLAVGATGLHARPHGFGTPHVTLTWDRGIGRELEVDPVPLPAREFAFIHSHAGQRRHELLGRWPMRG